MQEFAPPAAGGPQGRPVLSTRRVLRHDSLARAGVWAAGALTAVHLAMTVIGGRPPHAGVALPLTVVLLSLALVAWRLARFRALFDRGVLMRGVVVDAAFRRGSGRVWFDHHLRGAVRTWSPLTDTAEARALRAGDAVELLVLPDRPEIACPRALFAHSTGGGDHRRTTSPPGSAST